MKPHYSDDVLDRESIIASIEYWTHMAQTLCNCPAAQKIASRYVTAYLNTLNRRFGY